MACARRAVNPVRERILTALTPASEAQVIRRMKTYTQANPSAGMTYYWKAAADDGKRHTKSAVGFSIVNLRRDIS